MRVGDFGVEVIPTRGHVRELDSGHVLARPGEVYALRLRNFGPLRCVATVNIDGKPVAGGGLVLRPWSFVDLERPVHDSERGRFTVIAEGNETVFGPDGGRDNESLGLIEARFRRELPAKRSEESVIYGLPFSSDDTPRHPLPRPITPPPTRPLAPPNWRPEWLGMPAPRSHGMPSIEAIASTHAPARHPDPFSDAGSDIERAAGTGLTGHSSQEFEIVTLGELEREATIVQLRIVIGAEEALDGARPLPESTSAPARPAARP